MTHPPVSELEALRQIADLQPALLERLRQAGVVFEQIGRDPGNWQHIAFSIYTVVCEADLIARRALDDCEPHAVRYTDNPDVS